MKLNNFIKVNLLCASMLSLVLPAQITANPMNINTAEENQGYVANKDGLKIFFDALSSRLGKPVIASKLVARKHISGEFDFSNPQALLEKVVQQLGLIWYFDGQAIYVYDASELRNAVISLNNITLGTLENFLRNSGLYDARFPLKGDSGTGTFYISGPPVYVELVTSTAKFMDEQPTAVNSGEKAAVIQLSNTFVGDRTFELRGETVTIPGIATVIDRLLSGSEKKSGLAGNTVVQRLTPDAIKAPPMPEFNIENISAAGLPFEPRSSLAEALRAEAVAGPISVIANPDTNSLLVKGTPKQVQLVTNLVSALDIAKRHVELSLWIVDIQKEDLDSLGVSWQGGVNIGSQVGVNFNGGSYSTLDGTRFVASVNALAQKNRANIVSRPVVLTQENVPAIFDNNRTFYTQLIGERTVDLQHVTYGTMVSVLPRFAAGGQIEMVLNIEDGNEVPADQSTPTILPKVGRTKISTVARVPKGKSLLVGGYTRDETSAKSTKIPVLGSLPLVGGLFSYKQDSQSNTVRIFLIQPREITEPIDTDTGQFVQQFINNRQPSMMSDWSRNFLEGQKWR